MKCLILICASLLLAPLAALPAAAEAKTTGQATIHEMEELRALLANAVSKQSRELVIPPGIYRGGPGKDSRTVITLDHAQDLQIKAAGVTMVCTRLTRALQIEHCKNLGISGLVITYDPLPFTQGDIVKVAEDGSWVDVKIHQGYPLKAYSRIDVVDRTTRMRKRGMPFLWGAKASLMEGGVVRVTQKDLGKIARVGDLASMSTGSEAGFPCHGVVIEDSEATVLEDFTVHCAPGMGILESGGEGRAHFNRVQIIPGPPPAGATEPPILTTSWDAIQHKTCRQGPVVENCIIKDAGDDSWSIQASDYLVLKTDGNHAVVAARDHGANNLQAGDRLRLSLDSPEVITREVVRKVARQNVGLDPAVLERLNKAQQYSSWRVGSDCLELILDKPLPCAVGASVYSPDRHAEGYIFRNNEVHSSGRILLKSGHGVIENNKLTDLHGIMVCPEIPGDAAAGIRHITIRNNVLIAPGHCCENSSSAQAGAIAVVADAGDPKNKGRKLFRPPGLFEDVL
ncbi:MAG: hypothetical protein NTY53_20735, partial [Kiritimatiellaeota bacterium]|nr:hypothetical protein [Kiritimatiellota bacterium]